MLLAQCIVMVVTAAKRFDAVVLHVWDSARNVLGLLRPGSEQGLAE